MLKLQGEFALLQRQIDAHGLQVLDIAIDANTREAFAAPGKRIVLLPAHLTVGGEDTPHQGPSTLSGVTFIEEQVSGLTLLYLPDNPDGIYLRQYDTLSRRAKACSTCACRLAWSTIWPGVPCRATSPFMSVGSIRPCCATSMH
jgi:hypothetical protein